MTAPTSALPTLDTYLAERKALSKPEFLAKHPNPMLVITSTPEGGALDDAGGFRTQVITSSGERPGLQVASKLSATPVAKRMADAFQNFIWVGRESRCDVVLPFDSVSKLQAQFVKKANGELDLLDPGSTNGTFVDDVKLEKNKPLPVRDGARIRFGKLGIRFRTAVGFWEELGRYL